MEKEGSSLRVRCESAEKVLTPAAIDAKSRFLLLVPVYRELRNGNLAQFLASVAAAGAGAAEVDLFFLVNNSAEDARAKSEAFAENQRTLEFLAGDAKAPAKIHALDLSSAGFEKNMGKLRQAGLEAWRGRVPAAELARTVVVHLDADVKLPTGFFAELGHLYGAYPALGAAFFRRDYDLRAVPSAELLFTHHRYRLRKALFDFTNVRTNLPEGLATYQLSARFFAHDEAGGFPPVVKDEDSLFTRALCAKVWWAYAPALELVTEDRTRADGFNSARRARDLRGAARAAGWGRALAQALRRLRGETFAAVEALRPPAGKDFFAQFALFAPLAQALNDEVRAGRLTFAAAAGELRARIEKTLGAPVPGSPTGFAQTPAAEIPAEAKVPGTGGSVLPPVAHPVAACLLAPTLTPGTDLRGIFLPHASLAEQNAFAAFAEAELAELNARARQRRAALEAYFRGEDLVVEDDPFLAWVRSAPEHFADIRKNILAGRRGAPGTVEELSRVFPDYLSEGASFAREAVLVRALTRVLSESLRAPSPAGLVSAVNLLAR